MIFKQLEPREASLWAATTVSGAFAGWVAVPLVVERLSEEEQVARLLVVVASLAITVWTAVLLRRQKRR